MKNKTEIFNGIDLFKFLMAILVVANHTNPIYGINNSIVSAIYNIFINIAAPFFFITSGFLIFKKVEKECYSNKLLILKKYIYKLIKLYLIWNLLYLPITIFGFIYDKASIFGAVLTWIKGVIFIGEQFYSWPLWYILSSIYIYIMLYLFVKFRIKDRYINIVFFLLYIIGFIINSNLYNEITTLNKIFSILIKLFSSGRIFLGCGYTLVGKLIASNYNNNFRHNCLIIIIILFLLFSSNFINVSSYNHFLYLLISTLIFIFALNINVKMENRRIRFCSQVIYFLHMIFYFCYIVIFKEIGYQGFDAFLISLILSISSSWIFYNIQNKFGYLKNIF